VKLPYIVPALPAASSSAAGAAMDLVPSSVLDTFTPWVGFRPAAVEVQYKTPVTLNARCNRINVLLHQEPVASERSDSSGQLEA
jgi:hypothetical protein